jgi:hypothetical protein
MFKVQRKLCATCIYRPDLPPEFLAELEAEVADPAMAGHFLGYRECHHAGNGVCCRGFFEAHKERCTPLQIAQRLDMVEFVEVDVLRYQRNSGSDAMTRAEHLAWCKQRALEYVERGKLIDALASMGSDLDKHAETYGHAGIRLGLELWLIGGELRTPVGMRRFIEGFN